MADEPSAAELSPDEAYRSIGRYVYEFSQLVAYMRAMMTRYLDTRPQAVAELAFAQSAPAQIATAFFAMCRAVTRLDAAEEQTASRISGRVGEAIEMRENVAHGDWWVGASVLGAEAVERSARDLDARSAALIALTNLVAEFGALCLHQVPYDRGEHRLSEYIVMRAGEAVREGPKAIASPRVFYAPSSPTQVADAPAAVSLQPPSVAALRQQPAEATPREPEPEIVVEPVIPAAPAMAAPEPVPEPMPAAGRGAIREPVGAPEPAGAPGIDGRQSGEATRRGARRRLSAPPWLGAALARARPRARPDHPSAQAVPGDSSLPRWLTHQRLRRGMLALAAVTAALLGVAAYSGGVFNSLEQNTIATRFSIRGTQSPPSDIVIVAIDGASVDGTLPLWPFPRRYEANVINRIYSGGAKAIGIDIQFTTATDPTDDDDLINAVARAHGVVMSTGSVRSNGFTNVFGYSAPQLLRQFGAYAANAYVPVDPDALLTSVAYSKDHVPTFAVQLAERVTRHHVPLSEFPGGSALVDYAGPPGTFQAKSFVNVCSIAGCAAKVPPSYFRGKIVLIGVTANQIHDQHATPVSPLMSGVEYWANALWSILRGNPLRDASGTLNLIIVVLMALVMPLAVLWLRPGLGLVAAALAIALAYVVAAQLAFNANTVLSVVYPLVALTLGTVEATAADLWAERRSRRKLEVYKVAYERLPSTASAAFFISYRRDQSSWPARILRDELVRRFGEDQVFKDNDSIDAGQEWPDRLEVAIRNASVVLVLIGPAWADARDNAGGRRLENPEDWVRLEVEAALAHEGAAVVPVLVDGASMPAADVLPDSLRPLTSHQAFALSVERWNADLEALVASIQSGRIRDFLAKERAASASQGGS
jgi:CHASE2 domain-containing sensor protein